MLNIKTLAIELLYLNIKTKTSALVDDHRKSDAPVEEIFEKKVNSTKEEDGIQSRGSGEFTETYDTYDKNIHQEVEQSGSS